MWQLRLGEYYQNQGPVFSQDNGKPMHPDSVTDYLKKFSKRHGLPHINAHVMEEADQRNADILSSIFLKNA